MMRLRVVTYNIHKGVNGVGPVRRLEIHNLSQAVAHFNADIICLQEVRQSHAREAQRFADWPSQSQADFLAPEGYQAVYRTNAYTRHGEHGNAILSRWPVVAQRHEDMSDHRFEQRGLLHCVVSCHGVLVHVLVLHLGLVRASRVRQLAQVKRFIQSEVPHHEALIVAGDFNEWSDLPNRILRPLGLLACTPHKAATFPSRLPLVQLDYVYTRGLRAAEVQVPRGKAWWRMSDHLPLIADFELDAAPATEPTSTRTTGAAGI